MLFLGHILFFLFYADYFYIKMNFVYLVGAC